MLRLSIIIVTWNSRSDIEACLRSLGPLPPDCELWVVDNASTDGTVELLRSDFPYVRLVANSENVGFSRANNQALNLAGGKFILLLNPDTELSFAAIESASSAVCWRASRSRPISSCLRSIRDLRRS